MAGSAALPYRDFGEGIDSGLSKTEKSHNIALHLTAYSVRSCVAPASGGR
jgi:hypothetical protein